ncbi:MAG: helix-hairpin-helix domain-containing protein [Nanoarchaeota archaeon]|nr:helix-hairpin-helix domain-containing protein [Nanoarchaeota archaeon]
MKLWLLVILVALMIVNVSAECNSTQIDINSASIEELDKIIGVGIPTAEKIINSRPFDSVDSLTKVSGIKNATLNKIKQQGLACVIGNNNENTNTNDHEEEVIEEDTNTNENANTNIGSENNQNTITSNTINTNEETSKSEEETEIKKEVNLDNTGNYENNFFNYTENTKNIINLNPQQEIKEIYYSKNETIKDYAIYFFAGFLVLIIFWVLIKK